MNLSIKKKLFYNHFIEEQLLLLVIIPKSIYKIIILM